MEDCLFCQIAAGRIPATLLYQDEDVLAFADINPVAEHHILLIPRRHLASMAELTAEDGAMLGKLFARAAQIAHHAGLSDPGRGYRFVTNVGPQAGQSVQHLHFHLLGGRAFSWPPG
ncbi:MAG TPA: histidine triad nucleotide-binding protein [Ktedonobacteraceae bacterium]|jgi:histidine triad (HIT) family protein